MQGFVRVKQTNQGKILQRIAEDGLFVEYLASDNKPKPAVYWIPPFEGEAPRDYLARVVADAKRSATIAHRCGGGTYLGLRMLKGVVRPQVHAWSLQGAPQNWDAQDVLRCLQDSGVQQVEILKPPHKKKGWLIKGLVEDSSDIGVVGIDAGNRNLMLLRLRRTIRGNADTIEVLKKPAKGFNEPSVQRILIPDTPSKPPKPGPEPRAKGEGGKDEQRERSRSPDRSRPSPCPMPTSTTLLSAGGEGTVGTSVLRLHLALMLIKHGIK